MKKDNDTIKKDLLRRKINEYFSKNPQRQSVIIRANIGDSSKTIWRVVREGKRYNITEVITVKENFLFEDPAFNSLNLQSKLTQLATGQSLNYDTAISAMVDIVKDRKQDFIQLRNAIQAGMNSSNLDVNQKKLLANLLNILDSMQKNRSVVSSGKKKQKSLSENKKKILEADENETAEMEPPSDTNATKQKSEEEMVLINSLKGQTIKSSDIELQPGGGTLTLDLVSVLSPVKLHWNNEGRVVFDFKNRPYVLRK